ncbi:MAG: hypothetical protein ACOCUS_06895 [Polyangiales bacterium]
MTCSRFATLLLVMTAFAAASGCKGCDGNDDSPEAHIEPEPKPTDEEPTTPRDPQDEPPTSPLFDKLMESVREGPTATCDAIEGRVEALSPSAVDDLSPTEPDEPAAPEQDAFVLEWRGRWIALPAVPYRLMVTGGKPPHIALKHDSTAFTLSRMVDEPIMLGDGEPRTHLQVLRACLDVRRSDWQCDREERTASARRAALLMFKRGSLVGLDGYDTVRAHTGVVEGAVTYLGLSDDKAHIGQALPAGGSEWQWTLRIREGAMIERVQRLLPALGATERPSVPEAQPPAWLPDALAVADGDATAARRLLDADVPLLNEDDTRESLEEIAKAAEH